MIYEIGYDVGDGIVSVNMMEGAETDVKKKAYAHANRFNYGVMYITPISRTTAEANRKKGMPYEKIIS